MILLWCFFVIVIILRTPVLIHLQNIYKSDQDVFLKKKKIAYYVLQIGLEQNEGEMIIHFGVNYCFKVVCLFP